jgi:hypothetical protein
VIRVDVRDGFGAIQPRVTTVVYALLLGRWWRWARIVVSVPGFPRVFLRLDVPVVEVAARDLRAGDVVRV